MDISYMFPDYKPTKYEKMLTSIAFFFYSITWYITSPVAAVLHGVVWGFKDSIQGVKDRATY